MKTSNCFYLLLIFLSLFAINLAQTDSCPAGMRKTYVDDYNMNQYGAARRYMAAISFFQWPGSLFFSRKVLIEPRFEVHLKASTQYIDIIESENERKIYGFTIVISGYKNTISGYVSRKGKTYVYTDIGYNNFVNSLVIEFDFEKNDYDPDSNSFSLRFCDTSCNSNDRDTNIVIHSARLTSQKYDSTKDNDWDFRLFYANKRLSLYSGPNELMFSTNFDLEAKLGTNIAYVGFTGFIESNRRELSIIGTFICEDNYQISKMPGNFYVNNGKLDTAIYEAGAPINYIFSFINDKDQLVPHTFGYNIWNYTFFLNTDCDQSSETIAKDTNYTLILSMRACTKVGRHSIHISEKIKGDAPGRYYDVVAGPLNKIVLIGHDGIIGAVPSASENGALHLLYGDSISGDFIIKDNLQLVLDFEFTDQYGNLVTPDSPSSLFTLKKVNEGGDTSAVNQNVINFSLKKKDTHYQMTISVNKVGTYQIEKNDYMTEPIRFIIVPAEADPTTSYCTLEGYTSPPSLKVSESVTYNCYLRDIYGNEIIPSVFKANSIYDFSCKTEKTSSSKTYTTRVDPKNTFYSCVFDITETGAYQINGYLVKKSNSESKRINSNINTFSARGDANSLTFKNIMNLYNRNWLNINGAQLTYLSDAKGLITVLDLAESNGGALMSSYGTYPSDFKVNKVKALLNSPHDWNYQYNLVTEIITIDGVEYIGVYTPDGKTTDTIVKKSSFDYSIKFTLEKSSGNEEKTVTLKYIVNIGTYTTCFHDLKVENTNLEQEWSLEFLIGTERKIAKIELRTTDYYLYNTDIGKDKIQYVLENPSSNAVTFRVVPLSIDGTYDIYAKATDSYQGYLVVKVNGIEIRRQWVSAQPSLACYLEFKEPDLFKEVRNQDGKEIYYEYLGDFVEGNLLFYFKIKDKYGNYIVKDDYFSAFADIYSLQFGNGVEHGKDILTVGYSHDIDYYKFRDKLPFENRDYTWVFFMRDSSCNRKYYITYDGMRGNSSPVSPEKSYYTLLNTEINIKEYAYVDVFYKDENDQFLGLQEGKLEEMKDKTIILATNTGNNIKLEFDSITNGYAIRYKKLFTVAGTFKVTATSDGTSLTCHTSDSLNVIDNVYYFRNSQLQLILDSTINMDPNIRVTIDNLKQQPKYNLYFYTAAGVKTTYTDSDTFTCHLIRVNVDLELDVARKGDYVQFTHGDIDKFKDLVKGDYILRVSDNKETIDYPLYLTGDGYDDASNDEKKDLSKTEVSPLIIDGVAGKIYPITVEFRASDGYRWNRVVSPNNFAVSYSESLANGEFTYTVEAGYKKGQAIIYVNQTKVSSGNILTITYEGEEIPKKVTLKIKCAELAKLVYKSGPSEGNVINPPILSFTPQDAYGNLYTDLFTTSQTKEYLNSLTIGRSEENVPLTSNNYLEDNKLMVQYQSTISTNVVVTSNYFDISKKEYRYRIRSGPIDKDTSFAELITTGTKEAGTTYHIMIHPKDVYNNDIDDLDEAQMKEFKTYYDVSGTTDKNNVTECELVEESQALEKLRKLLSNEESIIDSILCQTIVTKAGTLEFHVDYKVDEIECRNCIFYVISDEIEYTKTKTLYKNKNIYLVIDDTNEIDAKVEPTFELTFFDQYENQIGSSIVQNMNIQPTLEGADIKLCISNSENKKIVYLCPSTDGDDNINKWQYITNGDKYKLILQDKDNAANVITYPLKITGGGDGSSEKPDFTKTNFNPEVVTVQAGVEGNTIMEIRTAEEIRKNYWYPNPSEKIKVEFESDQDTCSYRVEKGDLPGRYSIVVACTKTNKDNGFTVFVESTQIKTIKLIVLSGPAYYLEVEDANNKFTVSSDRYTWKTNPTNDDLISFNFKLKDKYQNYITNDVLKNNEITVSSETFGFAEGYYHLTFKESNKDYLFVDEITEVITKHIWNIVCVESNRKYSFIYTKEPGKVDLTQSEWTIDKTAYVLQEVSTVLVTLKDKLGVNVGTKEGRLLIEKEKLRVIRDKNKEVDYTFISITSDNKLKYTYTYKEIGTYKVYVTYEEKQIKDQVDVTVSYQTIDLKSSKLYYDLYDGKENLMKTTENTNINNKEEYLFYKLYLYTAEGTKITNYDHNLPVTCKMTFADLEWELVVTKEQSYIDLSYVDDFETKFKKLPLGLYNLIITLDGESITYPLYLLGEKDVSPQMNYDLTKTHIKPTYIDGVAGVRYEIDIEFRAQDNLRWNYDIILTSFGVSNSYNLDSENLIIEKEQGEKSGQMKLFVTQKIASKDGVDNVLSFTYKSVAITATVTLHIKCAGLAFLEYDSGAVDGTVINPSIVKFIPKDTYGNLFTDLFDETIFTKEKLEALTTGVSEEGHPLTTNNYVSDGKYLNVQYGCTKVTYIKLTCNQKLNDNVYRYKLWSGPISPEKSYAEVVKTEGVIAGEITKLNIYPKDIYGNDVTNVTAEDLEQFDVDYEVNKDNKVDISDSCQIVDSLKADLDQFDCQANVTKAGDVIFTVEYNDKPISCINCEFVIYPDVIDFSKTKVYNKNENKEMSRTELNALPVTILPNFELFFFDRFMNAIISESEVGQLPVETEIVVTDVKLCVTNNGLTKLSNVCKSKDNDENEEKWQYLPNGDNYQLIATNTRTTEALTFPVQLTGGYNGGESGPINPYKTALTPTELTLTAGEEKNVYLELRTVDEVRKNYWYKEPEKHISIKFPDDVKSCKYSLLRDEKPGDYIVVFNCTEKKDAFNTKVYVEGVLVPQEITISVVPAGPAKSKLFRMTEEGKAGEEIITDNLGSVSVEDKFQMINKLYDRFDNLITNINFQLSTLQIKMNPTTPQKTHTWSAEPVAQKNGEIIITLKSTYAGEHLVTGLYFEKSYTIIFTPGYPNADNSELEVSETEIYAGQEIRIYITPYDKYHNYIDASQYSEISPYQVKYVNEGSTTVNVITEKHRIDVKNGKNVLSYPGTFTVRGTTNVNGYIDTEQIKCISCRVNIKTKDIDFLNNYVLRFEHTKNAYELLKNGTVENNTKEEPIYRLYPRDQYENSVDVIPKETLITYKASLKSQNSSTVYKLRLNNGNKDNQEYAEFVIDDTIQDEKEFYYWTLVDGFYDLEFTNGKDALTYNITLAGTGNGGSNDPADYQKTAIIESNLKYTAGGQGYMIIEIRTSNNERKNFWDGFNFKIKSCDASDETFEFTQDKAGLLGVFYITVTTQKANTFPKLSECKLEILLNDVKVETLAPEMEVSPDAVVRTNILKKYYKEGSTTNLLNGKADENYVFEVESFDKYNNFAETIQDIVGIKVTFRGGDEIKKITSETDSESGYRKYSVSATKAGTYIVSTDKSGPQGLYLATESIFVIEAGEIDLSKTVIQAKATPIQAGTAPAISIDAYDKYGNALTYDKYINKFEAIFIDANIEEHTSKGAYDQNILKVFYTSETPVTIVGNVKVEVAYDTTQKLDTSKVIIEVIPGDPDPKNSILSRETSKGVFTQYKNGDSFSVDVKEFLVLNVTIYDKYNNYISNIPTDIKVVSPLMSGNYMEEITFNVEENTGYFGLDFNDNSKYIYIYRHLVGGTYDLTYNVQTSTEEASFKYNIIITSEDNKHGNGPYVIEKCVLIPKSVTFVAGNYETFTLELRTEQGLLYNDDIDIKNYLLISAEPKYSKGNLTNFSFTVSKAGSEYGIYTIKIYHEKKGNYNLNVLLADPSTEERTKKEVGPGEFTVIPDRVPDKKYTVFKNRPLDGQEIDSQEEIRLQFTLADKFNNTFEGRKDITQNKYLTLINNNEAIPDLIFTMDEQDVYTVSLYPRYPPKKMVMNVIYNDGEDTVYCFLEDVVVKITSKIDYYQTQIVSPNKENIKVGEKLKMWLYTFDIKGECLDDQDYSEKYEIVVTGPFNSQHQTTKNYYVEKTDASSSSNCNNEYIIITTDNDKYKYAGNYLIKVYGNSKIIAQYNQVCTAGEYSLIGFKLQYSFNPDKISILDSVSFTITGTDEYGNKVEDPLYEHITIYFEQEGNNTEFESKKVEKVTGVLEYEVSIHKVGPHQLHILYKEEEVPSVNDGEKLPIFTILPGPCRAENNEHFDITPLEEVQKYDDAYFTFQCYDIYGNIIDHGGEEFTVTASVLFNDNEYPVNTAEVVDNGDGTYKVQFIPEVEGTYLFNLLVGKERYGEDLKWILTKKECSGEKSVLCPNNNKCVKRLLDCVTPPDKCKDDETKPFWCPVNGTYTCVKSQTDCDCPDGYYKCPIMHYCVKNERTDMCPSFIKRRKNYCQPQNGKNYTLCPDSICRPADFHCFNQRVCPIGKFLCPDLSCRDTLEECVETEKLLSGKSRCLGQEMVNRDYPQLCPSTFTCTNKDDVVCPDGTCVSNEIYCKALKKCTGSYKYLCSNNGCAASFDYCTQEVSCPLGQSLCTDHVCRDYC